MNPRGRLTSLSPSDEHAQHATVCTISSVMDLPPNYEDALITSKPVNWAYLQPEKAGSNCMHLSPPSPHHSIQMKICLCAKHSNEYNQEAALAGTANNADNDNENEYHQYLGTYVNQSTVSPRDCIICTDELISSAVTSKNQATSNGIAQLLMSIVRGFSNFDSIEQQVGRARLSQDHGVRRETAQLRKLSFCQLNVNQLMLSSSPPKYCELVTGEDLEASANLSNNSNEPRAGGGGR